MTDVLDLFLEEFEKDNSDDSDVSSLSEDEWLSNDRSSYDPSNKRARLEDDSLSNGSSDSVLLSSEGDLLATSRPQKRAALSKIRLSGFSFSPQFLRDEDRRPRAKSHLTEPDDAGNTNSSSVDGDLENILEPDWQGLVDLDESVLPEWDWEIEHQKRNAEIMDLSSTQDLPRPEHCYTQDEPIEEPWYPFDPEVDNAAAISSIDGPEDLNSVMEPIKDEDVVCFGVIHHVRSKLLRHSAEVFAWIFTDKETSLMFRQDGILNFQIACPEIGAGFLLHEPKLAGTTASAVDFLAVLNKEADEILNELNALCTYEAYSANTEMNATGVPLMVDDNAYIFVDIVLYGQYQARNQVGDILDARRIFLQEPDYRDSELPYRNPHFLDLDEIYPDLHNSPEVLPQLALTSIISQDYDYPQQGIQMQSIRQRVAAVFRDLSRSQSLARIEADSRIRTNLKSYQEEALDFIRQREIGPIPKEYALWQEDYPTSICKRYKHCITGCTTAESPLEFGGGILADEMGLGKTLTMLCAIIRTIDQAKMFTDTTEKLASMSVSAANTINSRATLIIVPSPLILHEWKIEIEKHCPNVLKASFYHGQGRKGKDQAIVIADSDIVLSTYHTIAHEMYDSTSPLWEIEWFRIILDEAHIIRRSSTQLFKATKRLRGKYRWCLTGTPIQNGPEDLAALIAFIHTSPMDDIRIFRKHIVVPLEAKRMDGVDNLRRLLQSVCLRRTKKLLDLPQAIFDDRVIEWYLRERQLYSLVREKFAEADKQSSLLPKHQKRKYLGIFQLHLQLRRLCNHGTFQKLAQGFDEFDPQQAMELLRKHRSANCEYCGVKVTGVRGIEEERGGTFTICGHLICHKCRPRVESALHKVETNGQTTYRCAICQEHIKQSYFLAAEDSPRVGMSSHRRLSMWDYFDRNGCSTKMTTLINDIVDHKDDEGKSIVFSCWTRSLDLVGMFLLSRNIPFCRIDGTMSITLREKILEEYQHGTSSQILLMTTGTGAVGLNLTAASCVYILEPQWNPMVESQAIGRILRLGQTRNVRVVRYLVKETVETVEMKPQQKVKIGFANAGWMDDA